MGGCVDGLALFIGIVGVAGTITGSIMGARLGGRYVKESVLIAAEISREAEADRQHQEILNLRKALLVEIDTLKANYMEGIGKHLEAHPDTEPFSYIYPVYQRYFVIFEENAHLIGKVPNDRERELIVQTYTMAKGLLDSYKLNNSMCEKQNYARGLGPVVLGQNYRPVEAEISRIMAVYTPILKKMHFDVLERFKLLRESLLQPIDWG